MSYEVQAPTSGSTISASGGVKNEIFVPVSGGFSFVYVLPPNPNDGDIHSVSLGVQEPALTISVTTSDGSTINGPTTRAVSASTGAKWLFDSSVGAHGVWYNAT